MVFAEPLLRILAGVEPVVTTESKVLRCVDLHRITTNLTGNRDATFEVIDLHQAGLIDDIAYDEQVLIESGGRQATQVVSTRELLLVDMDFFRIGIFTDTGQR